MTIRREPGPIREALAFLIRQVGYAVVLLALFFGTGLLFGWRP